jgi:hypothetical protein
MNHLIAGVRRIIVSEWQPIETAPIDGTRVLLFSYASTWGGGDDLTQPIIRCGKAELYTLTRDVPIEGTDFFKKEEYESVCWVNDETHLTDDRVRDPTHWMPLPPPPTA